MKTNQQPVGNLQSEQGQGQSGQPAPQSQAPGRIDVQELFAMIGELNVQLRVSNQVIGELQSKNKGLEKALADMRAAENAKKVNEVPSA